jgi:hypothetical protein
MTQFGAKMNFLCILQVSRFVFVLKMNFYNYFSVFNLLWTGPQFLESAGVTVKKSPRLREQLVGLRVLFPKTIRFLSQNVPAKGYAPISAVRLNIKRPDQILLKMNRYPTGVLGSGSYSP